MKVIETIGLPGSGKSTLTPIVKRALQEKGVQTFDATDIVLASRALPARRLFVHLANILPASLRRDMLRGLTRIFGIKPKYQSKFKSNYPELFSFVDSLTQNPDISETHQLLMIHWFLNLAAFHMISKESEESATVILEEGFAHKAVTLFVASGDANVDRTEIETYLDLIPVPDVLFSIEADVDTCRQRLSGRALPRRLRGKNEKEIFNYLHRTKSVLEQVERNMIGRGCRVIKLNNTRNGVHENIHAKIGEALQTIGGHMAQSKVQVN